MEKDTRETVTTRENNVNPAKRDATGSQTIAYLIYFLFGALEILLVFRFVLKLLGASLSSGFVSSIYDISRIFILPFEGIFRTGTTQGAETTAVFEPATLVAIIVYAVLAWGIVKLISIFSGERQAS
ncbi:MAG: YggT family protein [bacterium]|nr:YggT family protein [bacterium]